MNVLDRGGRSGGSRCRSRRRCGTRRPCLIRVSRTALVRLSHTGTLLEIKTLISSSDSDAPVCSVVPVLSSDSRIAGVYFGGTVVVWVCASV